MDNITVGGVTLHSPLLNAAGTMGFGSSYADYIDLHRLGGLVTRTMTVKPRRGAEAPRLWETPSGLLNCVGMQNPGYEKFTQVFYKGLVGYDVPIIASVTGTPAADAAYRRAMIPGSTREFTLAKIPLGRLCRAFSISPSIMR